MTVSTVKERFECDVERVWNTVTSLENYSWRSGLSEIKVVNENKFIEYAENGYATTFTVTKCEPYKLWEFDLENDNMEGHWIGRFSQEDGYTELELTEDVTAKKLVMKPFVKSYLKVQQSVYIDDLKKALGL